MNVNTQRGDWTPWVLSTRDTDAFYCSKAGLSPQSLPEAWNWHLLLGWIPFCSVLKWLSFRLSGWYWSLHYQVILIFLSVFFVLFGSFWIFCCEVWSNKHGVNSHVTTPRARKAQWQYSQSLLGPLPLTTFSLPFTPTPGGGEGRGNRYLPWVRISSSLFRIVLTSKCVYPNSILACLCTLYDWNHVISVLLYLVFFLNTMSLRVIQIVCSSSWFVSVGVWYSVIQVSRNHLFYGWGGFVWPVSDCYKWHGCGHLHTCFLGVELLGHQPSIISFTR